MFLACAYSQAACPCRCLPRSVAARRRRSKKRWRFMPRQHLTRPLHARCPPPPPYALSVTFTLYSLDGLRLLRSVRCRHRALRRLCIRVTLCRRAVIRAAFAAALLLVCPPAPLLLPGTRSELELLWDRSHHVGAVYVPFPFPFRSQTRQVTFRAGTRCCPKPRLSFYSPQAF